MKQLDSNLKSIFPNAKYVESDEPMITDDMIYLTEWLHISVGTMFPHYTTVEEKTNGDFIFHNSWNSLQKAIDEAIKIAFKNKKFSLN